MAVLPVGATWPTLHWWLALNAADQAAWAAVWTGGFVGLLAAAGGFAAAWASFRAARVAVAVAKMPMQQQEEYRLAKARVVATAIATEFVDANHSARSAANWLRMAKLETSEKLASIDAFRTTKTAALDRFFDRFDAFGLDDGIVVANAAAAALNFNSQVDSFKRNLDSTLLTLLGGPDHEKTEVDRFVAACDATSTVIQKGLDVLARHGAKF